MAAGQVDFDQLFQDMVRLVSEKAEAQNQQGLYQYADLCEFLCAEYPQPADRARFAQQLRELDQKCCQILGGEVAADAPTEIVPAVPASDSLVGQAVSQYRVRLWQLGFAEEAAVRGQEPGFIRCFRLCLIR